MTAPRRDPVRYEAQRAYRLKARYGITLPEYDQIKNVQGGLCALCRRAKGVSAALQVDHDHDLEAQGAPMRSTVRGLLCGRCNNRLGWYEARSGLIVAYLADPPARRVL